MTDSRSIHLTTHTVWPEYVLCTISSVLKLLRIFHGSATVTDASIIFYLFHWNVWKSAVWFWNQPPQDKFWSYSLEEIPEYLRALWAASSPYFCHICIVWWFYYSSPDVSNSLHRVGVFLWTSVLVAGDTLPSTSNFHPPESGSFSLIPASLHVLQGTRWPLGIRKWPLPGMKQCYGLRVPVDKLCPLDIITISSYFLFTSTLHSSSPLYDKCPPLH